MILPHELFSLIDRASGMLCRPSLNVLAAHQRFVCLKSTLCWYACSIAQLALQMHENSECRSRPTCTHTYVHLHAACTHAHAHTFDRTYMRMCGRFTRSDAPTLPLFPLAHFLVMDAQILCKHITDFSFFSAFL